MLDGKTVLITGASRGIGRAISTVFSEHGCFIGINYHEHKSEAEKTLEFVHNNKSDGLLLKADISDRTMAASIERGNRAYK